MSEQLAGGVVPRAFYCSHPARSELDERGQAICLGCGTVFQVTLTREVLGRYFDSFNDQGPRGGGP